MKRIIKNGFFILLGALLLGSLVTATDTYAEAKYKDMHCRTNVTSKTNVKISWKKQNGAIGYKVYRKKKIKEDKWSKAKLAATLPSTQTSLTDKAQYKKSYQYTIVSLVKKGKKTIEQYTDYCYAYMGVGQTSWDEYLYCDAITTPDSIRLLYFGDYWGMAPDTYEIYRSKTKKNFKKIASVKSKKNNWGSIYTDKKVMPKTSYYYKVRAYKILNGKKIYGKYSIPILLSAVNSDAKFQTEVLTPEAKDITTLDILLISDSGNADTLFNSKYIWDAYYWSENSQSIDLKCSYSLDGKEWKNFSEETIIIKPEEKIYLRFERANGASFFHPAYDTGRRELMLYDFSYNRLTCYLTVDFAANTAIARTNGEYYH